MAEILCCPDCGEGLDLIADLEKDDEVESGKLLCTSCEMAFPIIRHIPRFVSSENYAQGFGFQWNEFRQTQLDSYSGHTISKKRFFDFSGWSAEELAGKRVLDVGCGAGRFAEVALDAGAHIVAVDYSSAVDACWLNLGSSARMNVIQGDIYCLPIKPASFDFVYCLGVLQHTPDVKASFMALTKQVKPGGTLVVDLYPKLLLNYLWPKYWLRPFTSKMPQDRLFKLVVSMVSYLLPVSIAIGRIPVIGRKLRYAVPVVNYDGILPLSKKQLREWSVLDTFDMLSPAHDHPQSADTLQGWFEEAGMSNIEVFRQGFFVGRGVRPL